jgi:hypothetical protein
VKEFNEASMLSKLSENPFPERIVEILHEAHRLFGGENI